MAKPASVVVSTALAVVLAVGMIPASAFAAASDTLTATPQAAQPTAAQPKGAASNSTATNDSTTTGNAQGQANASDSNSAAQAEGSQEQSPAGSPIGAPATQNEAAEQTVPATSTQAIEPQLSTDPAQIDALAAPTAQSSAYAHSASATQNGVAFTVEWNDAPAGQATTFHVTAAGGSGPYMARMDVPTYWDNGSQESVCDSSRGSWTGYATLADGDASTDFQFEFTASGTYRLYFYFMSAADGIYYLRTACAITVDDAARPSVTQIVDGAVAQCKAETDGSEYAMALWLHDWAIDQLEYDRSLNWCSAESGLTRGLGTCESYQRIYAKLLNAAGIANGRIEGNGHTWNAAKIDGEWCQMDLTWDDSDSAYGDLEQRHLYFGLTDELMAIAHSDHAKNYQAEGYAYRSTNPTNDYYVRNGKAREWADAYSESIQEHLDAREAEFEIDANNPYDPPSISGIKNGLIAWQMNQMDWKTDNGKVELAAESKVEMTSSTSWTAKYAFGAKYVEVIPPAELAGTYRLALAMAPSMGVAAGASGSRLSSSATALALSRDAATGLYAISAPDGRLLTADGRAAALRDPDGAESQLWALCEAGGGYVVRSASSGMVLDSRRAGTSEGNEVRLEWANGTGAQVWALCEPL